MEGGTTATAGCCCFPQRFLGRGVREQPRVEQHLTSPDPRCICPWGLLALKHMATSVFVEQGRNVVWDRAREGVPPLLWFCVSMFPLSLGCESGSRRKDRVDEGTREWAVWATVLRVEDVQTQALKAKSKTTRF